MGVAARPQVQVGCRQAHHADASVANPLNNLALWVWRYGAQAGQVPDTHAALVAFLNRLACQVVNAHVFGVVGKILVEVDVLAVTLGQAEHVVDMFLRRDIVVGNAADHIGAFFHGLDHHRLHAGQLEDAFLRESDHLDINHVAKFFAQFQHPIKPGKALYRVELGVGAHVGGARLHQGAQYLGGAFEDVVAGQGGFELCGDRDRLFQRAGAIGLAMHDVGFFQVQVPFDKPRYQHVAVALDFLAGLGCDVRRNLDDVAVVHRHIHQRLCVINAYVAKD